MVMHGDARWCLIMMHDHASSGLVPYRSLRMIKYDQNVFLLGGDGASGWEWWERGFWNLLLQSCTYRLNLTEWFCFFWLKTTNKSTKWFVVFWKMPIHRSQVGLVLQNGLVFFWLVTCSQMGLCAEQLYKMVLFFQKNEKTPDCF